MSHRGGALEFIENTLPGFRNSVKSGYHLLELDVQETLDGEIVIFHDDRLTRMTGVDKAVSQVKYNSLPPLLYNSGSILQSKDKDNTRIPLLKELLEEFPNYPMQIDLKSCSESAVLKVGDLIHKYNRVNNTLWGSFQYPTCSWIYKHYGTTIPRFMPFYRMIITRMCYHIGLLGWININEQALIIHEKMLHKGYVEAIQDRGLKVLVFGNSLISFSAFDRVYEYGIDAICTDTPGLLKRWLTERNITIT